MICGRINKEKQDICIISKYYISPQMTYNYKEKCGNFTVEKPGGSILTRWSPPDPRHLEVLDSSALLFMPKMTTWIKLGGNFRQTYLRDFVRQSFKNIKVMKEKKDLRIAPDWETKETWHVNEMHDPRLALASGETIVLKDIIGIIGEIWIWTVFQIIVLYGCYIFQFDNSSVVMKEKCPCL